MKIKNIIKQNLQGQLLKYLKESGTIGKIRNLYVKKTHSISLILKVQIVKEHFQSGCFYTTFHPLPDVYLIIVTVTEWQFCNM